MYYEEAGAGERLVLIGGLGIDVSDTSALPDGGTQYNYSSGSGMITWRVPPASFNIATASATALAEYGFQHVSPTSSQYAALQTGTFATPPPTLFSYTQYHATAEGTYWIPNWSGDGDYSYPGTYTEEEAIWNEPADGTSPCDGDSPPPAVVFWGV